MSAILTPSGSSTSHFWVAAFPFVDTSLFFVPPSPLNGAPGAATARLFDADGILANELTFEFPRGQLGVVEVENIMGGCKLESGCRYGHLVVNSPAGGNAFVRMHTREGAALVGEPTPLQADRSSFFPLTMDEGRSYFLAVVNYTSVAATLKCRLFCAKRSPETLLSIPGMGARLFSLEHEFADHASADVGKQVQAYVRLSTKSETTLGVQLIERIEAKNDNGLFYAVS